MFIAHRHRAINREGISRHRFKNGQEEVGDLSCHLNFHLAIRGGNGGGRTVSHILEQPANGQESLDPLIDIRIVDRAAGKSPLARGEAGPFSRRIASHMIDKEDDAEIDGTTEKK